MAREPLTVEAALELLEGKIVQTEHGPAIRVNDLRKLRQEFADMKQERDTSQHNPKTMYEARELAKKDPHLMKALGGPTPAIEGR